MWSIALETLIADRAKLLTALVGVVFSIVLVNVQGGFFWGLIGRASLLVDHSRADIWCGHRQMCNIDLPRDIPRRWVYRIRGTPGVRRAEPYVLGVTEMTLPTGGYQQVVVVGAEPQSQLGRAWNIVSGGPHAVRQPHGIIVDRTEIAKLEHPRLGDLREIAGHRARIAGMTQGIMGFLVFPYVFTTYDHAAACLHKSPQMCSYILVQTDPAADPHQVCQAIRQRLPEVDAFTRQQYSRISINYWMTRTGLGISFGAATLLGLLVGMVIVAQTLYALVLDRLLEFGTLKALGASEAQVYSFLLVQAMAMAAVGTVLGLATTWLIQSLYSTPRAPIVIPWWLVLGSTALVWVICLGAAILPYRRVRRLDPMLVLQG